MITKKILILLTISLMTFPSCIDEEEWLDVKSNKSDVKPETLDDFQALLDNDIYMNSSYPGLGMISADNSYVPANIYNAAFWQIERNAYIWAPEIHEDDVFEDWSGPYETISYANVVLDGLLDIERVERNSAQWDALKGSALFFRSYAFYNLAQAFAKPYDESIAATAAGIPLRMTSDVNEAVERASLQQTYDRIITDLREAEGLLPDEVAYPSRPSMAAATGLLARVYLTMGGYEEALNYANKTLSLHDQLIDYNELNPADRYTLPAFPENPEVIFYSEVKRYTLINSSYMMVDNDLFSSYSDEDLRKVIFYSDAGNSVVRFKGQYTGGSTHFGGIATGEMYLIKAESLARLGRTEEAMEALNDLLINRWNSGDFIPFTAADADEALEIIIEERRKELPFTGTLRWEDLRRLNQEERFAKTLTRTLEGTVYTLPPNDARYVFDIPDIEVELTGIDQNKRL